MSVSPTHPEAADGQDPTWSRLEDQLDWYDTRSQTAQQRYTTLKVVELIVAASLPVVAGVGAPALITGMLSSTVVVLEGLQHLFQYHANWILYRATAEALKHERFLYLANAGPYSTSNRRTVLAERIEGLVSQEHARWTESQQPPAGTHTRVDPP